VLSGRNWLRPEQSSVRVDLTEFGGYEGFGGQKALGPLVGLERRGLLVGLLSDERSSACRVRPELNLEQKLREMRPRV
jgi:hypothetical protein